MIRIDVAQASDQRRPARVELGQHHHVGRRGRQILLDAADVTAGPVARVRLPERIAISANSRLSTLRSTGVRASLAFVSASIWAIIRCVTGSAAADPDVAGVSRAAPRTNAVIAARRRLPCMRNHP